MKHLTINQAEKYLAWANEQNPGQWVEHSQVVASTAARIAEHCNMDAQRAYCLGLLHDIGRYKGVSAMMHILDGYELLMEDGYKEAAQVCITHSFPTHNFEEYSGADDCTATDRETIKRLLSDAVYSNYDKLIQLCDSLALPSGICLMEKRLVDVALRHGTNAEMLPNGKLCSAFLSYFSLKCKFLYILCSRKWYPTLSGQTTLPA